MEHQIVGSHPDAVIESSLQVFYAVSTGKQVTDVSKNRSVFIFRVMQCQRICMDFSASDTVKCCHDYYFHYENYKQTAYIPLFRKSFPSLEILGLLTTY